MSPHVGIDDPGLQFSRLKILGRQLPEAAGLHPVAIHPSAETHDNQRSDVTDIPQPRLRNRRSLDAGSPTGVLLRAGTGRSAPLKTTLTAPTTSKKPRIITSAVSL